MVESRIRPFSYLKEWRHIRHTRLVEVREAWIDAPELPFAYKSKGNIITIPSLSQWRKDLNKAIGRKHHDLEKKYPHPLSRSEATREYHRLRFLSRSAARAGMEAIAKDILANFDPRETLISEPEGSGQFLYKMIADQLQAYGTIEFHRDGESTVGKRASFQGDSTKAAKTLINIDDWVLSGAQTFGEARYNPQKAIAGGFAFDPRWFMYHLVMSDTGKRLYDIFGLRGKTVYKLVGDDGPDSIFGDYPVYGFHKIPDVLSSVFADTTRYQYGGPSWTIFPDVRGVPVGKHTRLIKY